MTTVYIFEYLLVRSWAVFSTALGLFFSSRTRLSSGERISLTNPLRVRLFFVRTGGYLLYFGKHIALAGIVSKRYQDELDRLLVTSNDSQAELLDEVAHFSFAYMRLKIDLSLLQIFSFIPFLFGNKKIFKLLSNFSLQQKYFLHANISQ